MNAATLDAFLNSYVGTDSLRSAVAATVHQLAQAAVKIRHTINQGVLGVAFAGTRGVNSDGDIQKDLDVFADEVFLDAMRQAPVALYASEELEQPVLLNGAAPLAIAIDPLDGSSNIDTNVSIGTIFSHPPRNWRAGRKPGRPFFAGGRKPARRRFLHLRAATGAGPFARQRHACLRALDTARHVRPGL